ncbi:MAG: secretion protein, partial [Candidatus Kapaibacteriota bacterium]
MKPWILFASFLILTSELQSQDTFSIVAADSITREVGSAGASCVDLIAFGITDASFLGQLFPDKGAINTQAAYIPGNQQIAAGRMNTSDSPKEIAEWL